MNPVKHVAIIMDGNGRWGIKYRQSRNAGHRAGLNTVDLIINQCVRHKIEVFQKELTSLRTGRANASMLDLVKVDVYGQAMPLNQVSSITTPDARTINIQVWDLNNVPLVDTAIKKSELGLNPQIDGQLIRLPIPDLNEERRTEIKKLIKSMGEKCKISIRNIRREANDDLKSLVKDKIISEDDEKVNEKLVQTFTDDHIKIIDTKVEAKEKEIMTI